MEPATFFPRAKSKRKLVCVVKGCDSASNKGGNIRFHYFPMKTNRFVCSKNLFGQIERKDQLEFWIKTLKIKEVNSGMKVCSLHFCKDDYILPNEAANRRRLKTTAIPSLDLPQTKNTSSKDRNAKVLKRNSIKNEVQKNLNPLTPHEDALLENKYKTLKISTDEVIEMNADVVSEITTDERQTTIHDLEIATDERQNTSAYNYRRSVQDAEVQVETLFLEQNFIHFLTTDAKLSTFTGIESFAILDTIVEIVTEKFGHQLEHHNTKMSIRDKILMTYVKLKQNMAYNCLAILFHCCSENTCQRVFLEMIQVLSACLKNVIKWSTKEIISKNMPLCFEGLEDVRVVLDCTEIFVQQPGQLCCQLLTYSTYKKGQTVKFMTGVTPAETISYVSRTYGGRTSDKAIFNDSDIKKLLQPGDGIMVDKGFTIDDECLANKWICYRPPFLRKKQQFSKLEAILTSKIAKARVHVERSNQRIKNFKTIGETMPSILVPVIEHIFIVICATVNLSSPIIKDDKFMNPQ